MSSVPSTALIGPIVFLLFFVYIIVRRTIRMMQGTRFSVERMFIFAGLYVVLFAALAFTTLYAAVATWGASAYLLLVPYLAVPVVSAFVAIPYVRRIVRFERRGDGQLYYRLSWHVPVLYLALFITRLVAEVVVLGPSAFLITYPPPAPPTGVDLYVLIGVDLLFAGSLGLLIGRGIGVYLAHRDLPPEPAENASPPSPPLPSR